MKILFFLLFFVSTCFGQVYPNVGELIARSQRDVSYIEKGEDGCILAYTLKNRHLFCADIDTLGGSGQVLLQTVTLQTEAGAPYVESDTPLPASSIIDRCLAIITSEISGGVWVGVHGGASLFGQMEGTINETNEDDHGFNGNLPSYGETELRITAPSEGTFTDGTGEIIISCYGKTFEM